MRGDEWTTNPVRRGSRLLGRRTGLLSQFQFHPSPRDGDDTVTASADAASLGETLPTDTSREPPLGLGGKGATTAEAATTLFGEFCERYCILHPLGDAFDRTTAPAVDLDAPSVPMAYLDTVDQQRSEQFGFRAFDEQTPIDWVRGVTPDGDRRFVPAQLVSISHQFERTHGDGRPYFYTSSNGSACGSRPAGAALRAVYERIERDALMRVWYTQTSPPRLDPSGIPAIERAVEQVSRPEITPTFLDLGGVGAVHVVGVVVRRDDDGLPQFVIAASASLDPVTAAREALSESMQVFRQMRRIAAIRGYVDDIDPQRQTTVWACPQYYARPEQTHRVAFLTDGPTESLPSEPTTTADGLQEELAVVLDQLADEGVRPVFFDVTTRDVRRLGMHVFRVITPGLVDLPLPAIPPVDHPELAGQFQTKDGHPVA